MERGSLFLFLILLCLIACEKEKFVPPQLSSDATFAEVVKTYAPTTKLLLDNLNLDNPGLEEVKAGYVTGEEDKAIEALFTYFKQNPAGETWRSSEVSSININQPILDYLKDSYTFLGVKAKVSRNSNGLLDWKFIPPGGDQQFPHYLNRFIGLSHWARAAKQTGTDLWINFLNNTLCDWVISNPYRADRLPEPLPTESRSYEFGGSNNYPWLILNAGVRLRAFQQAFYHMLEHELMQPKTFLLLLSSIEAHADYLYTRGGFNGDNWDNITLDALLKVSGGFPEFKRSHLFKKAAADRYFANLQKVWYEDGSQWELAGHYGLNVLNNSMNFFTQLTDAGHPIPADMLDQQRDQVFYIACTADPNGNILPANDSDPNRIVTEIIRDFAQRLEEPEALFLMTNGREGASPTSPSSRFFEYSGNLISRDRWQNTQQWSWFDIGPFGMGHNHADKLSLNIYNGRKILVDPGRFTYGSNNEWATYRKSTRTHNTITIDGANQKMISDNGAGGLPGAIDDYLKNNPRSFLQQYDMARHTPIPTTEYEITEDHDFARGRVTTGYEGPDFAGQAVHERGLWYERGKFWLVIDRIFSDREREIKAFWHFHPDCRSVEINAAGAVYSKDPGQGNIIIIPVQGSTTTLNSQLVKGQEIPYIQGWYSPEYNEWTPSYDVIYSAGVREKSILGWLIVPFAGTTPPLASASILSQENDLIRLTVKIEAFAEQTIDLPLDTPPF